MALSVLPSWHIGLSADRLLESEEVENDMKRLFGNDTVTREFRATICPSFNTQITHDTELSKVLIIV